MPGSTVLRAGATGGATVLLTGATGFLGKVVLEQLLRRSGELGIERVVALVRAGDEAAAERRLREGVLSTPLFDAIGADARARVRAVAGDVALPLGGLAPETLRALEDVVTHVVHCAASIEFDLPVQEAAQINVRGALHVLELARRLPHLARLVSVSTAYVTPAAPDVPPVAEALVPLPRPASELLRDIESGAPGAALLRETGHPNTYTFTKCLAEHLLVEQAGSVPLSIVRPSIISATWAEPFPGWIDSAAAFAGFVALVGTGHLRVVVGDPNVRLDVVPADVVAQRILDTAFAPAAEGGVPIRHAVSGLSASPTILDCRHAIEAEFGRHRVGKGPQLRALARDGMATRMAEFRWHRAPAALATAGFTVTRNGRMLRTVRRLSERLHAINRVFPYFTHHEFDFCGAAPPPGFAPKPYLARVCAGVRGHLLRQDASELSFAGREHRAGSVAVAALRRRGAIPAHRPAAVILDPLFRRTLSRATVDAPSFEAALADRAPNEHVVLVASHRSYFDFLLIPYLSFLRPDLGLPPPHIAADESFGRLPGLGRIASASGAFFLRRGVGHEVKGLTSQIHALVARRQSLLVFIVGRRSRTRAMLPPKRGLLRALQSTGEAFRLVPIAISYDRVVEEAAFAEELSGGERAPMRVAALLGWLRRVRRGEVDIGRAHVACGPGIRLDLRSDVETIASRTMDALQGALVTTTFHLRAFLERHPVSGCDAEWLAGWLRSRGVPVLRSGLRSGADLSVEIAAGLRHHFARHVFAGVGPDADPRVLALADRLAALDAAEQEV